MDQSAIYPFFKSPNPPGGPPPDDDEVEEDGTVGLVALTVPLEKALTGGFSASTDLGDSRVKGTLMSFVETDAILGTVGLRVAVWKLEVCMAVANLGFAVV